MQDIWHQGLEAHVLNTGNVLSALEVVRGTVLTTLARVVDDWDVSLLSACVRAFGEKKFLLFWWLGDVGMLREQSRCSGLAFSFAGGTHGTALGISKLFSNQSSQRSKERVQTHLGHLTKSAAFFSEINHDTTAAVLGFLDSFLDAKDDWRFSGRIVSISHPTDLSQMASTSQEQSPSSCVLPWEETQHMSLK